LELLFQLFLLFFQYVKCLLDRFFNCETSVINIDTAYGLDLRDKSSDMDQVLLIGNPILTVVPSSCEDLNDMEPPWLVTTRWAI
jgi:hypothetical protein